MEAIDFYSGGKPLTGSNYSVKLADGNMLRTQMESGPQKQRPMGSKVFVNSDVTYLYTKAEYVAFLNWYKNTAGLGSLYFNWVDPFDGVTKSARIINGSITDAQVINPHVTHWAVRMTIETYL